MIMIKGQRFALDLILDNGDQTIEMTLNPNARFVFADDLIKITIKGAPYNPNEAGNSWEIYESESLAVLHIEKSEPVTIKTERATGGWRQIGYTDGKAENHLAVPISSTDACATVILIGCSHD